MRYIEVDSIIAKIKAEHCDKCKHDDRCFYCDIDKVLLELEEADEADVVEVVRCKDCKWYQESKLLAPNKFCYRLKHPTEDRQIGYNYADDDFCSYGERGEE